MKNVGGGFAQAELEESITSHEALMAKMPGLRQSLGAKKYQTILELSCSDTDTYHILTTYAQILYVGLNTEQRALERMQSHYEQHQERGNLVRSGFFKRDIMQFEERGSFFDLICINSLQYNFRTSNETDLKKLILKLLRHGRKVIFHVILADELGTTETIYVKSKLPFRALSQVPAHCFYPILLYQGIAQACGRAMHTVPGQRVEFFGVRYETTYLVFE